MPATRFLVLVVRTSPCKPNTAPESVTMFRFGSSRSHCPSLPTLLCACIGTVVRFPCALKFAGTPPNVLTVHHPTAPTGLSTLCPTSRCGCIEDLRFVAWQAGRRLSRALSAVRGTKTVCKCSDWPAPAHCFQTCPVLATVIILRDSMPCLCIVDGKVRYTTVLVRQEDAKKKPVLSGRNSANRNTEAGVWNNYALFIWGQHVEVHACVPDVAGVSHVCLLVHHRPE